VFQKANSLDIVGKIPQTRALAELGQKPFPVVAKRRVTDVMPQGDRFNEVLIEAEEATDGPGDL
jgi:hypothetical protein